MCGAVAVHSISCLLMIRIRELTSSLSRKESRLLPSCIYLEDAYDYEDITTSHKSLWHSLSAVDDLKHGFAISVLSHTRTSFC